MIVERFFRKFCPKPTPPSNQGYPLFTVWIQGGGQQLFGRGAVLKRAGRVV